MMLYDRLEHAFHNSCQSHSARTVVEINNRSYTYAQLDKWSDNVAQGMLKATQNNMIALYMEKSVEFVVAVIAALKANLTYLPIDPKYPSSRIQYMLDDCKCDTVVTNIESIDFSTQGYQFIQYNSLNLESETPLTKKSNTNPVACLIYTSGSTGQPKPVMVTHKGILNLITNQLKYFNVNSEDRILQFSSISFDASIPELWIPLISGATLVIPQDKYLSGDVLANVISEQRVSVLIIPPSILDTLTDPSALKLKTVVSAGEALTNSTIAKWLGNLQTLINAYGPSEATVCTTYFVYNEQMTLDNIIGKPLDGVDVYILNADLSEATNESIGELYIGGIGMSPGYYCHPEIDKERFIQNPFHPEEKLYKSGDLVRKLNDGNIQYVGRVDRQVKINGIRIELEEIENHLTQHEIINAATVYLETNTADNEKRLVAYFTATSHDMSDAELVRSLRAFMLDKLPPSVVPHKYMLIKEFPRLPNGKIDKSKSIDPSLYLPFEQTNTVETSSVSSTERELSELYAKVLQIDINDVLSGSDFFDLGGTSLSAIRLISEIKKKFSVDLSIDTFFSRSSLNDLLKIVKGDNDVAEALAESEDLLDDDLFFDLYSLINDDELIPETPLDSIKHILVTGSAGFLGAYLLHSLLKQDKNTTIHCIIRAEPGKSALQKLQDAFVKYHLDPQDFSRVMVYEADLSNPNLGLSQEDYDLLANNVDTIYHCAAAVNHLYPYERLRQVNVLGTIELLKFAICVKKKSIHYISALDISLLKQNTETFSEEKEQVQTKMGYIQTKWVSEYLLEKAASILALSVRIYRPGNIIGDLKLGIMEPSTNHFLMFTKGCIQLGYGPNSEFAIEMTPVDIIANSIVNLSQQQRPQPVMVYHLHNPNTISWKQYVDILNDNGYPVSLLPSSEWINTCLVNIDDKNALYLLKDYYMNSDSPLSTGLEDLPYPEAAEILESLSISYPSNYEIMNREHISQLQKVAFL